MKYPLHLLAGGLLAFSVGTLAMPLDPLAVGYNIDARGAHSVVADLTSAGQLTAIEDSIRLGDDAWIALTPKLINGDNSTFNAAIKNALASALLYNPAAVLGVAGHGSSLTLAAICHTPDNAGADFAARAQRTLATIRNADLFSQRDACIAALQK